MTLNPKAQRWNEVSDGRRTDFAYLDVDLSNAQTDLEIDYTDGGFLYIDKSSGGDAQIKLNSKNNVPIYMGPGSSVTADFTKLFLSNVAQPGKTMRLIISVDGRIQPGVDISTLDKIVEPVTIADQSITESYKTGLVNNSTANVVLFDPAANVNGFRVNDIIGFNGGVDARLMANNAAPASWTDGIGLAIQSNTMFNTLGGPMVIPAGYGVYARAQNAVAVNYYFEIIGKML